MSTPIHIDDELYQAAKDEAQLQKRSITDQIELWAKVGRAAIDNPDLPTDFILESLLALKETPQNKIPFEFRTE